MNNFLRFAVLIFFLASGLQAQITVSVIDSSTSSNLVNAEILVPQGRFFTNSEGVAEFQVPTFPTDIIVSHTSYYSRQFHLKSAGIYIVRLQPLSLNIPLITVTAVQPGNLFGNSGRVLIDDKIRSVTRDISTVINRFSGTYIKEYGGSGSLKTISFRGLSSENTEVLFNEININDAATGLADLSDHSANMIDILEMQHGISPEDGFAGAGGRIKMTSGLWDTPSHTRISLKADSDLLFSSALSLRKNMGSYFLEINTENVNSPNRYSYFFDGQTRTRENAFLNKKQFSISAGKSYESNLTRIYLKYSDKINGLPGFVVSNNYDWSKTRSGSETRMLILNNYQYFDSGLINSFSFSASGSKLFLADPDRRMISGSGEKKTSTSDLRIQNKLEFGLEGTKLSAGLNLAKAELNSSGEIFSAYRSDSIDRLSGGFFINAVFEHIFEKETDGGINAGLIFENEFADFPEKTSVNGVSAGLSYSPRYLSPFRFYTTYSIDNRFPTFNEIYYASLFNHTGLTREKFKTFEAGISARTSSYDLEISYFNILGDGLIVWTPFRAIIQVPRNIRTVSSYGLEVSASSSPFPGTLRLGANYTWLNAINKTGNDNDNAYNKRLIYTPSHKISLNAELIFGRIFTILDLMYAGSRYYTADNDSHNKLKGYLVTDFSAGINFPLLSSNASASLTVYNLLNAQYFVIQSYPMPLRNYSFTLNLNLL